jgi:transcriptional regulator with XRE-family HTH domain
MATRLTSGVPGPEVRRRSEAIGLTVSQLAKRLGVHPTSAFAAVRAADAPLPVVRHLEDLEALHRLGVFDPARHGK